MTCRTAWAGEQLHDFEAGTPVATGCHALGAVPWQHHPSPLESPFNGASLHCRNRGLELVVPALAKSLSGQRHIDVRFLRLCLR
jgi:hypothetical protein